LHGEPSPNALQDDALSLADRAKVVTLNQAAGRLHFSDENAEILTGKTAKTKS
jgi:hypothetical protein